MKKYVSAALIGACAMLLTACGSKIPKDKKIRQIMEDKDYAVTITEDESLGSIVTAKKGSEFLYVYRLNSADDTETFYSMFESGTTSYDVLYRFQNDSKLGNVVICGTQTAFDDSGIVIKEES